MGTYLSGYQHVRVGYVCTRRLNWKGMKKEYVKSRTGKATTERSRLVGCVKAVCRWGRKRNQLGKDEEVEMRCVVNPRDGW